jgi:hypothetical protein
MSDPRGALDAAYRATDYRVEDAPGGPFVVRIGDVCAEVDGEWAFVTACNPGSVRLSDDENGRRMADLEAQVRKRGWRYHHGHGVGRDGNWPPEPSLLVVGIAETEALELAERFGQNAIVVGRGGEAARLAWTGRG